MNESSLTHTDALNDRHADGRTTTSLQVAQEQSMSKYKETAETTRPTQSGRRRAKKTIISGLHVGRIHSGPTARSARIKRRPGDSS
jgi:hypothetical protein